MERFKKFLPELAQLKPLGGDGEAYGWEACDAAGNRLGYVFSMDVPESLPDIPGMEDMDRYVVLGAVDTEYKVVWVDISIHPEKTEGEPWDITITEPEFEERYTGLTVEEIELFPDGKIDAITDATLSSTWITDAIREKIQDIIKNTKGA